MSENNENNNNNCEYFETKVIHAGQEFDNHSIVPTITHFKHDPTSIEVFLNETFHIQN